MKNLIKTATLIATAGLIPFLSGCSSTPVNASKTVVNNQSQRVVTQPKDSKKTQYASQWNIKDPEIEDRGSKTTSFQLDKIVLDGNEYYPQPNFLQTTNELPFALYAANETSLAFDDQSKRLFPRADSLYVPKRIFDTNGIPMVAVNLSTTGPYALKVDRNDLNSKVTGVQLGTTSATDKEISFSLNSLNVGGFSFYAPHYSGTNDNRLNVVVIPAQETTRVIKPDGSLRLESRQGLYFLVKTAFADYVSRTNAPTTSISHTNTTGQVNSID